MDIVEASKQDPAPLELVVDRGVGISHRSSGQPWHLVGEAAVWADRVQRHEAVLTPHLAVDLTEGGRKVDEPCAVFRRDVVGGDDDVRDAGGGKRNVIERANVLGAEER